MIRIFITGCARSGTTLLNRLFHSFENTEVISPETSLDDFCTLASDKSFLVAKRIPLTILSVPLPEVEFQRQLTLVHQHNIHIVNTIRDGRDVVHQNPTGPCVNVNRWIGCILQARQLHRDITAEVRYEDLTQNPDTVQQQLAKTLKLRRIARFSSYPSFVPDTVFDEVEYRDFPYYRKRPIDSVSIGHSPTEYISLCTSNEERAFFERTLARLGYIGDRPDRSWEPTMLAEECTLFRKISEQLGYMV